MNSVIKNVGMKLTQNLTLILIFHIPAIKYVHNNNKHKDSSYTNIIFYMGY